MNLTLAPDLLRAALISGAVAVGAFWLCLHYLRRARAMEDTPVSLVRSAAQGPVELQGNLSLMPGPPIVSPLSNSPCVWWSYEIKHREPGEKNLSTIEKATSEDLFYLNDGTGNCIVDPVGAEVVPSLTRSWAGAHREPGMIPKPGWDSFFTTGSYYYSERLLKQGDHVYAQGWFRTQTAMQEFNESREISELLAEWKKDHAGLMQRFDKDGDGELNPDEWESARQAAIAQVRGDEVQRAADPDLNVLCKPPDHRPYVVSALSRQRLAGRYRRNAIFFLLVAAVAAGTWVHVLHLHVGAGT